MLETAPTPIGFCVFVCPLASWASQAQPSPARSAWAAVGASTIWPREAGTPVPVSRHEETNEKVFGSHKVSSVFSKGPGHLREKKWRVGPDKVLNNYVRSPDLRSMQTKCSAIPPASMKAQEHLRTRGIESNAKPTQLHTQPTPLTRRTETTRPQQPRAETNQHPIQPITSPIPSSRPPRSEVLAAANGLCLLLGEPQKLSGFGFGFPYPPETGGFTLSKTAHPNRSSTMSIWSIT